MAIHITETGARTLLEARLPDSDHRRQYLSILADAIVEINRIAPNQWSVSVQNKILRLVVGHFYTYTQWTNDEVWLALDGDNALTSMRPGLLDSDKYLPGWRRNPPGDEIRFYLDNLKQPFSINGYYDLRKADPNLWWVMELLSFGFLSRALQSGRGLTSSSKKAHEAGVLEYMRKFLRRSIPVPSKICPP